MSSEQFSQAPLPPLNQKRCIHCGEVNTSTTKVCWLCLEKIALREGLTDSPTRSRPPSEDGDWVGGDNPAWATFGVAAMLLGLGLALAAPGVLLVFVVLAMPALIRAAVATVRFKEQGPVKGPVFLLAFLNSMGVTLFIGIGSFVVFVGCFVVTFLLVCGGMSAESERQAVTCASIGGGVVALVVALVLFVTFWPTKRGGGES